MSCNPKVRKAQNGASSSPIGKDNSDAIDCSPERRDLYEVLGIPRDASDDQIKAAYRKLALKYHPDKNGNNPEAAELFKEVAYSYNILSDPDKRKQYDTNGFMGVSSEGFDVELDLSNLGTVNTMFAALFSKLGVPIKTTVSTTVLEEAINGSVVIRPLQLGSSLHGRVEKQGAHFFETKISEAEAEAGIVIRVSSTAQNKFKLLYFEREATGGLELCLQEDSTRIGSVSCAGMYFLHFQVYRIDATVNAMAIAKDPDSSFFKKLEGLQPCEVSSLKAGTHIFAVYGDNFFKSTSYTIEAICAQAFKDAKERLKGVEAEMLRKRNSLHEFEAEYKQVLAHFHAVTTRYSQEKQELEELLKQREFVQSSFSSFPSLKRSMSSTGTKLMSKESILRDSPLHKEDSPSSDREKPNKKKWFTFKVQKRICILYGQNTTKFLQLRKYLFLSKMY